MNKGYILRTDADFDNAMLFGVNVEVWIDGRIVDYGGKVEGHDRDTVTVQGGYYLKENCEFRVR